MSILRIDTTFNHSKSDYPDAAPASTAPGPNPMHSNGKRFKNVKTVTVNFHIHIYHF
jgi:hypothetical protein